MVAKKYGVANSLLWYSRWLPGCCYVVAMACQVAARVSQMFAMVLQVVARYVPLLSARCLLASAKSKAAVVREECIWGDAVIA